MEYLAYNLGYKVELMDCFVNTITNLWLQESHLIWSVHKNRVQGWWIIWYMFNVDYFLTSMTRFTNLEIDHDNLTHKILIEYYNDGFGFFGNTNNFFDLVNGFFLDGNSLLYIIVLEKCFFLFLKFITIKLQLQISQNCLCWVSTIFSIQWKIVTTSSKYHWYANFLNV